MTAFSTSDRDRAALGGFVCCMVGDAQYAVRGDDVRAVARADRLWPTPGERTVGTLRHAGCDVPVYTLASLLGLADDRHVADRHVLVARGMHSTIGLLVDRVIRTPAAAAAELRLPPVLGEGALRRFAGLLQHREWSYLILSPASLDPCASAAAVSPLEAAPTRRRAARGGADLVAVFRSPALPPAGVERYAVPARLVAGLAQALPSLAVPGAAPYVTGLAWWRDEAVAVVSFAPCASASSMADRFLVVRCAVGGSESLAAFAVDRDIRLHRATAADVSLSPPSAAAFVRGFFKAGTEDVALLALEPLLDPSGGAAGATAQTRALALT